MAECIECGAPLNLQEDNIEKGEILSCPECGVELEVTAVKPTQVALAPQEQEDWGE
jgi:alpha-aminoadipate/glutamate carrier protein LysW